MRAFIVGAVAVVAVLAPVSANANSTAGAADRHEAVLLPEGERVVADQQVPESLHGASVSVRPSWVRTCGFANCSVYFNRSETRIAAYGGALLSSLICTMLRSTPAALVCTAIAWAVGKAGDSAVSGGRCVKLSFSRWTGVVYYIGTYQGVQCK